MNLPIAIVGIGPGFSFPYDGPTHHGIQDISNTLYKKWKVIYWLSNSELERQVTRANQRSSKNKK